MSNVLYYTVGDDLTHHGIKGQKWGQKNGPPYPLGASDHSSAEKKAGTKGWSKEAKQENKKKSAESRSTSQVSKAKNSKSNIYEKHREKLINEYKKRGYSEVAAETATKRRIKTELLVGAVATVAAVVIIRKVGIRLGQDYCDKIIKSGATIQNIGSYADADFQNSPFYAAINKNDKRVYAKAFPWNKLIFAANDGQKDIEIFNNTIGITKDIKRASVNTAAKILSEKMNSDMDFRDEVMLAIKNTSYGRNADTYLKSKDPKKFYSIFNQALATPEFRKAGINDKFYSVLQSKGYNAILDINDTRKSSFSDMVKEPTIFFGADKWEKIKATKIEGNTILPMAGEISREAGVKRAIRELGTYASAVAVLDAVIDKRKVEKYLDEHPDSELSEKEIKKRLKQKT